MKTARTPRCASDYVSGYRQGKPCPYRASHVVVPRTETSPWLVCGYHARAYSPGILYPLNWSLAEIRRWQRMNLDAFVAAR
jgi:hypothetical protein